MNKSDLHDESIFVFTHKSINFLTSINGSTSWKIDPFRARKCKYIICVKNRNHRLAEALALEGIDEMIQHRSAFLIGRVSNVVPSSTNEVRGQDRYTIQFDQYAEINTSNDAWTKLCDRQRWPVKYLQTEDLKDRFRDDLGIDFDSLNFQDVKEENWDDANIDLERENEYLKDLGYLSTPVKAASITAEPKNPPFVAESSWIGPPDNYGVDALTISQAKAGLSLHYDIPEENIEIILKG